MSSGADLFVVCKQCGSHVSPYITECPYCGNRLRRRAPKLPKEARRGAPRKQRVPSSLSRLRPGEIPGIRGDSRPLVTVGLVLASVVLWVLWRGAWVDLFNLIVLPGGLHGDWYRLVSTQFTYSNGFYMFTALVAIALFGTLLERRHGPLFVLALFFFCGVAGTLVAVAAFQDSFIAGANGAALGLLCCWAIPDVRALRAKHFYDGDLLGTAAIAGALLGMPLAIPAANWLAGLTGGAIGLAVGAGVDRMHAQ
jgi:membrane associated rhomboid family serine protease